MEVLFVKGSLQEKHGTFYVVVNYKDEYGKPKAKWISTGLRVQNNKTKAKEEMKKILKNLDQNPENLTKKDLTDDIYFIDFLHSYLPLKKQQVEPVTFNAYVKMLEHITSYFKNMRIKLKDLKPYHIEGFYKTLYDRGLKSNSVLHYHVFIREALQYAFKNDLVNSNVADKVTRPKTTDYQASFYSVEEMQKLFEVLQEHECKLPIMLASMYGLRRSEVVGLKWDAIDFENKVIKIQHKVLETKIDGKRVIYTSDKLKNKTSNRALPLLPQAEELLLKKKESIDKNKAMLGKAYKTKYIDYVCVDNIGRLILPNRLTKTFLRILRRNDLREIRFHDLRHSCASIMLANGVPMKQIQEWLGHADFSTTANIYSHLDYASKISSANTISNAFNFVKETNIEKPKEDKSKQELEDEIERLQQMIKERAQEDEEYLECKRQREKQKKKQEESEM